MNKKIIFFVTHHIPDLKTEKINIENLFKKIKNIGIDFNRFDARWNRIKPGKNEFNEVYLKKIVETAKKAQNTGIKTILIISSPPTWLLNEIEKDQKKLFYQYENLITKIRERMEISGVKVKRIQIFNEINNSVYTPRRLVEELPELSFITKKIFGKNTKISVSLIAGNLTDAISPSSIQTGVKKFINIKLKNKKTYGQLIKDAADIISVGYYPGLWNFSLNNKLTGPGKINGDFSFLDSVLYDLSKFNKELEIGEIGFMTFRIFNIFCSLIKYDSTIKQREAYEYFCGGIIPIIRKYRIKRIGFYQLLDQNELAGLFDFGIFNERGEEKEITKSYKIIKTGNKINKIKSSPPLKNIINFIRQNVS